MERETVTEVGAKQVFIFSLRLQILISRCSDRGVPESWVHLGKQQMGNFRFYTWGKKSCHLRYTHSLLPTHAREKSHMLALRRLPWEAEEILSAPQSQD